MTRTDFPPRPPHVFVVAEGGVNHNGDIRLALGLVEAAKGAGADAVKFQAYRADALVTGGAPKARYQDAGAGEESQREMLQKLELSWEDLGRLKAFAEEQDILFFASHFDPGSLEVLVELDLPILKTGSGELTDHPLLRKTALAGRPVILSTGMATEHEIAEALAVMEAASKPNAPPVVLLHAVSAYPCPLAEANVKAVATLAAAFGLPVGFSDHTEGDLAALAAVALGACVIEKHLTLDRTMAGPDHPASMEPREFGAMVRKIRSLEEALGSGEKVPQPCELETMRVARKSLVADRDISAGTILVPRIVSLKRPGTGLPWKKLEDLLGRVAKRDIPRDTLLAEEMFEP